MKKIILLSLVGWLFTSVAWAQDKVEAPVWKAGYQWTYRGKGGEEFKQKVIAVEDDIYIVQYGKEVRGYDKSTMNLKFLIEGDKRINFIGTRSKVLDFPLYIGKRWSNIISRTPKRGSSVEQNYLEEYFVSSYEDVKVISGTFKALKIEYLQKNISTMRESAKGAYWYSTEVKAIIKRIEKVSLETGDIEMVSYKLME